MNTTKNILVFPHTSARRIATTAHFPCTKSNWFIHVFLLAYSTSSASSASTRSIIIQLRLAGSHLMHSKLFQQSLIIGFKIERNGIHAEAFIRRWRTIFEQVP